MEIVPIFLIGFSVCWYALQAEQLLRQRDPSRLQRLLGMIFVWWGLSTLKDLVLYVPGINTEAMLQHVFCIDACGAVTFALLLMELTMPGWMTVKRVAGMSAPFVIFFVLHFFVSAGWFLGVFTLSFVVFAWVVFLIGIYKGRIYARAIRQNYSDLEDVDISWVWYILVAFFICQHVWLAVSDTLNVWADSFYYAASLLCWAFTLRGVNRLRPLRLPTTDNPAAVSEASPSDTLAKRRTAILAARLEQLMENERPYLNPELTMGELVLQVGTNRTYMSEFFSSELNTTFYDYINRLRIERGVLPLMQEYGTLSLDTIASQSGFKSMSTFRRAFRKFTGQLPSEYVRHWPMVGLAASSPCATKTK